jgi:hypothetical protein
MPEIKLGLHLLFMFLLYLIIPIKMNHFQVIAGKSVFYGKTWAELSFVKI